MKILLVLTALSLSACATVSASRPPFDPADYRVDQENRVVWARTQAAATAECQRRDVKTDHSLTVACHTSGDDVIVLWAQAETGTEDHEWCHRWTGWQHEVGNSYPYGGKPWPKECNARPWRKAIRPWPARPTYLTR